MFWLEFFCCYRKKAVTRIECTDITESPDELRIFSVLIGAFAFIWFDLFPQLKMEKQRSATEREKAAASITEAATNLS